MFLKSQFVFKGTVCFKVFLLEQFWGKLLGLFRANQFSFEELPDGTGPREQPDVGRRGMGVGGEKPRGGSGAERS